MRIRISGTDGQIADQKRAYAEYRFFTSIAPYAARVDAVNVAITRGSAARAEFLCTVAVDLGRSGHIKTRARGLHPSAAIDRAADRAAWLIGRRIAREFA